MSEERVEVGALLAASSPWSRAWTDNNQATDLADRLSNFNEVDPRTGAKMSEQSLDERLSLMNVTSRSEFLWTTFHRLWTACVGTKGYNKASWIDCERQLIDAGVIVTKTTPVREP